MIRRALPLALLALLAVPAAGQAKRVRVFAVGPKFSFDWVDTRAHYHDKLLALVDKTKRGGAPTIQAGADDVASHLRGTASNSRLVVLPEDIGLMSAFVGSRGDNARNPNAGLAGAILTLEVGYAPVMAYYGNKYQSVAQRPAATRLLALALTDTFARTAVETFAELARTYHTYLEAGVNMAQSWQVVCKSKATFKPPPGVNGCDEEDASKVDQLKSPDEPDRDYAYEATSAKPSNMALVFDPNGRLISKQVKAYITPTELPTEPTESGSNVGLDLAPGPVSGVTAVHTPVATLGFVTSKDAWMPDITAKLDVEHVNLLVQPEFFVNDTVRTTDDNGNPVMWAPDTLKAAGYSDVLRDPSVDAMVLPELTGNVYDFSADAQQHVVVKPRPHRAPKGFLVGQPSVPGFLAVQPWIVPDPVGRHEPFKSRRARLGAAGEKALPKDSNPPCDPPDKPGPCRGGQVEGVLWKNVTVGGKAPKAGGGRRGALGTNRRLAPSHLPQRDVALAARGRRVWAAYEQRHGGRDKLLIARSTDGGRHWRPRVWPFHRSVNEWWPSISAGPDGRVWVAWQDNSTGGERAWFSVSRDGGRHWATPKPASDGGTTQWKPSIVGVASGAVITFVDEQETSASENMLQAHVYVVRVAGGQPQEPVRVDTAAPVTLAKDLDNSWAPSLAVNGRNVLVSWVDFHTYDWRTWARQSGDGGRTFGDISAVNDTPAGDESLDDTPRSLLTRGGPLVVWTDFRKRTSSSTTPHQLYDIYAAVPGQANHQIDQHRSAQVDTFSPTAVALPKGGALAAWQDNAAGVGSIFARRVGGGATATGRARRLDGGAGANSWQPALALSGSRVVAAWEDERTGTPQIWFASGPLSALR